MLRAILLGIARLMKTRRKRAGRAQRRHTVCIHGDPSQQIMKKERQVQETKDCQDIMLPEARLNRVCATWRRVSRGLPGGGLSAPFAKRAHSNNMDASSCRPVAHCPRRVSSTLKGFGLSLCCAMIAYQIAASSVIDAANNCHVGCDRRDGDLGGKPFHQVQLRVAGRRESRLSAVLSSQTFTSGVLVGGGIVEHQMHIGRSGGRFLSICRRNFQENSLARWRWTCSR